jgi:hypothetical protein
MINYTLEHILSYTGALAGRPEIIGPVPEGVRVNFYTTGGEMTAGKVRGKVRPVGGDWMTVRRDGVATLDIRQTFETHDGALILVTCPGVIDLGEDGYDEFLRGELPSAAQIRTSPRFLTSHPEYLWLNRLQCFGVGEYVAAANAASYDVYAIR